MEVTLFSVPGSRISYVEGEALCTRQGSAHLPLALHRAAGEAVPADGGGVFWEEAFFGLGALWPRSPHTAQTSSCSLCASPGRKVLQNLTRSLFGGQAGLHSCSAWGELGLWWNKSKCRSSEHPGKLHAVPWGPLFQCYLWLCRLGQLYPSGEDPRVVRSPSP